MTTMTAERGKLAKIKDDIHFYPHQLDGVRQMARINSFLLADEMGLGKSLQALTVSAIDFELGYASRVLIVAPATLKWNWADECEKFTNFSYTVLDGDKRKRSRQIQEFKELEQDVLIVNYEQVKPHLAELNSIGLDIVIWDEAHMLKNPSSQRTKASLSLRARRKFILTGSPLLNQVNELYTILHLINPTAFPSYRRFMNRYCVMGGYKNKQVVSSKNKVELMGHLSSVMVRRLKKEVLDLPDKLYIPIMVDLTPQQKALYEQAKDEGRIETEDGDMEFDNALTRFLRLKEVCATTWKFTGEDHSSKLDVAVDKAIEVLDEGEPVVIFTQFRPVIERLEARLAERGEHTFSLHGDIPIPDRANLVKTWGKYKTPAGRPSVLIAGLQVSGVGLTMTAASTCIFVDKLFVPKLNEQAEDRLHRIGADKTRPIRIIQIVARNTIEHRIEMILKTKSKLFATIVDSHGWQKAMTDALREEIVS